MEMLFEENSDSEMCESSDSGALPVSDSSGMEFRELFVNTLLQYDELHQGSQKKPWTEARLAEVINAIKVGRETLNSGLRRTAMEYYWMNKYDVKTINNEDHLIYKRINAEDSDVRIIPREKYFEVLTEIHEASKHGGRDKMLQYIRNNYYIPKKAVEFYVSLCPKCHNKRNVPNKESLARQKISLKLNIRGQVELFDFQSCPDGDFKWLLSYQDEATKFLNLRPLKTNDASEVLCELTKIFLTFGAPKILQMDNRHEFATKLTENITSMWSDCRVVHRSATKGSNQEFEQSVHSWMTENNSKNWSVGCFFIQYDKNTSVHNILGKAPFKTLFGCDPKADLSVSNLPVSVVHSQIGVELKIEPKIEPTDNVPGLSSDENDC